MKWEDPSEEKIAEQPKDDKNETVQKRAMMQDNIDNERVRKHDE